MGLIDSAAMGGAYSGLVIADGAAGAWKLDDASAAFDVTGNGHDGTVTNGTLNTSGGPGNRPYLSFAGSGQVTVPYWSALNTIGGAFSAEIWFRCASAPAGNTGVLYRSIGGVETWGMDVRPSRVLEAYYYNGTSYPEYASGNNVWATATWNHFVLVKAGSSGAATLYLNGTSIGTITAGAVASNTWAGLVIGGASTSAKRFTGDLALAAWYPTALSGAQVAAHAAAA